MHSVQAARAAVSNRVGRESGIFTVQRTAAAPADGRSDALRDTRRGTQQPGQHQIDAAATDEVLVAAMLTNAPTAWREFQRRYDRLIHRCITKVTRRFASVLMHDDVREIYATLFLSLLSNEMHKLRTFDPERGNRFSSWIGLLAINCAYDYLRALKREPSKGTLAEATDLVCQLPDPYEHAVERERAEIAARMLDGFSEKDRAFAALYFGEGMEPNEIARTMNISVKTVYSKKHKIQSRLESVLGAERRGSDADESGVRRAITESDGIIAA